ncbi:carbohydrate ABC transporter permease [Cohnella thailandensis]|uniref:Carbohydrate ABC transporter permease n=1 Tax=Cohnella thailandensis TaxID=557557 RepID=A0A841SRP9_9BACL|nr:carbohydrate ABC transporter permease [Cohnella thailandensis]MBB6634614.1 carbohydrate ABC transporter permease [Cohnella thailandensis]MBP1972830.1 raffinose/stachyose/melibiose transport system permease protein [Cohnella thailandensis]
MADTKRLYLTKVVLWIYSCFTLLILGYLVWNSFRSKQDVLTNTIGWPREFTFDSYAAVFRDDHFGTNILNSVFILAATLLITVILSSMVAYGLGRYKFKFKQGVMMYFLVGLMFPIQLGVVPVFLIIKNLDLINSPWSVILVLSAGLSMPVLLLTNFFSGLPEALAESARLEGAGEWRIFYRIMFPLASPVIVSLCIVLSVSVWNQFFLPLILLQDEAVKTIPLAVMKYTSNILLSMDKALATSVLATVPILLLFFLFSERIISGVASGSVKE